MTDDLTGRRFGMLVVAGRKQTRARVGGGSWLCRCDCGQPFVAPYSMLVKDAYLSCGCSKGLKHRKHGHGVSVSRRSKEYSAWMNMKSRCLQPSNISYKWYGGRGITICQSWANDFSQFYLDVGPAPSSRRVLDRIDPDGHYEPGNVRWVTTNISRTNQRPRDEEIRSDLRMEIRRVYNRGDATMEQIGMVFGVSKASVHRIVHSEQGA